MAVVKLPLKFPALPEKIIHNSSQRIYFFFFCIHTDCYVCYTVIPIRYKRHVILMHDSGSNLSQIQGLLNHFTKDCIKKNKLSAYRGLSVVNGCYGNT